LLQVRASQTGEWDSFFRQRSLNLVRLRRL
jgi:hypothetical protein